MKALQTKMRVGGWLALFALSLQLTLSFGHIHAEDFAAAHQSAAQTASVSQNAPLGDHDDGDRDLCAICAVMHMAGTSALPDAPSIVLPADFVSVAFVAVERTELPPPARQSFQARAPPQA